MRKKLLRALKTVVASAVFLGLLFTVLTELSYLFRYREEDKSGAILQHFYAEQQDSLDVVMIGSSATYRYYIPAQLFHETGLTSALFAYPAMPFEAVRYVIDEVEKTQSPQLYLVELRRFYHILYYDEIGKLQSPSILQTYKSYISGLLNAMPVSLNRAGIIHKSIPTYTGENELEWQFEYMRTHNNWKTLTWNDIKTYLKNRFFQRKAYTASCKDPYKISQTALSAKSVKQPDLSSYTAVRTISPEALQPLDELLAYIDKHHLPVLFVSTPCPVDEISYAYEAFLESYLLQKGVAYLNCNHLYDEIGLDFSTDFYDKKHCNLLGAIKYTGFIGTYLTETFGLQPRELSASLQTEWQEAYARWNEEVALPGIKKLTADLSDV